MSDHNDQLAKWFEEFQKIPSDAHLLCPRINNDDEENYKILQDPDSQISLAEKKSRIEDGHKRIEITYWNTLIFGFDKRDAGKWLDQFTLRLENGLKYCSECVFNWHLKRKPQLQKFSEYAQPSTFSNQLG
jgi:senataxin